MNLLRLHAMMRKEFLHVLRDPRSLGLALAIPMLLLLLFGYALNLDVDRVPLVVWDQDRSPSTRELLATFTGSSFFSFRGFREDYEGLEQALDTRRALAALIIPAGFSQEVLAGREAKLQLLLDGSDSNTATIALGYAEALVAGYSGQVTVERLRRSGLPPPAVPLELRTRVWYNPNLESRNAIVPGLIAVIMMLISALLTSLTVAREWETGTMEQLISTPVKRSELVLGKLLPYCIIAMIDVVLAVVLGEFLFQVPLRGSVALLFMTAAICIVGAMSIGLFISIATRSQLLSSQITMMITYLPTIMLSGFMFAITNMPWFIQLLTWIFPARYFVGLIKGIYMKGLGLEVLLLEMALVTGFAALITTGCIRKFQKRLV